MRGLGLEDQEGTRPGSGAAGLGQRSDTAVAGERALLAGDRSRADALLVVKDHDDGDPCVVDAVPVLDLNRVISHAIVNDNRTFVYRVVRMGCRTGPQLEREFINVDQILQQYWLHHTIRNREHLRLYLINNGMDTKWDRLLWPQMGRYEYRRLLLLEQMQLLWTWTAPEAEVEEE